MAGTFCSTKSLGSWGDTQCERGFRVGNQAAPRRSHLGSSGPKSKREVEQSFRWPLKEMSGNSGREVEMASSFSDFFNRTVSCLLGTYSSGIAAVLLRCGGKKPNHAPSVLC